MDTNTLAILFMTVIAPLWIVFHYVTRWRMSKTLTSEDEKILADLWRSADRMEARITNIERILDAESKDWRLEK